MSAERVPSPLSQEAKDILIELLVTRWFKNSSGNDTDKGLAPLELVFQGGNKPKQVNKQTRMFHGMTDALWEAEHSYVIQSDLEDECFR